MDIITRQDAIAQGLPYYYTGATCKNGHTAKRQTLTGNCYDCILESNRRHRDRQREEMRENARKGKPP